MTTLGKITHLSISDISLGFFSWTMRDVYEQTIVFFRKQYDKDIILIHCNTFKSFSLKDFELKMRTRVFNK